MKQIALTGNQACNLVTDWCDIRLLPSWDYKQEPWTAIFEVSPVERTCYLEPFPNWDSRCAVTWNFPALIKSGCRSKHVGDVFFALFLFSFNVSILKVSWIILLQEGGPFPGPETGLLSNTRKWIVQGDTCADKARDFIGKGHPGGEQ